MQRYRPVSRSQNERLAFELYLRTGKIVTFETEKNLQLKFNPWHDPNNGRFTFAAGGTYYSNGRRAPVSYGEPTGTSVSRSTERSVPVVRRKPFRPGGGDFGGGGATGSWSGPSEVQNRKDPRPSTEPATARQVTIARKVVTNVAPQARPPATKKPPLRRIVKNGYNFDVSMEANAPSRTERVSGNLRIEQASKRSRSAQSQAGGTDRKPRDDGGHFIGVRFNGPHDWFNHFAQDSNFNRGVYRSIEDGWAKNIKAGKRVFVDIDPHYTGQSKRPDKLSIRWTIDGKEYLRELPNKKTEK